MENQVFQKTPSPSHGQRNRVSDQTRTERRHWGAAGAATGGATFVDPGCRPNASLAQLMWTNTNANPNKSYQLGSVP